MDFGIFGLLVMPGVYGFATGLVYAMFRRRPSLFWLIVQIEFLIAVVLAFRTHKFFGNTLIVFGAVAAVAQLLAGARRTRDGGERGDPHGTHELLPEGVPAS